MKDKSEKRAREIIEIFKTEILKDFKDHIEGLILVGSLTNDSYIEGIGRDIDIVSILKDNTTTLIKEEFIEKIASIERDCNNDIPISKSVYYLKELTRPFITDIEALRKNRYLTEVAVELFRIHESGVVLYGEGIKDKLSIPTKEEYINLEKISLKVRELIFKDNPKFKETYLETLMNPPIHLAVQIILTRALKHYYYATSKVCCNKNTISELMNKDVPSYKFNDLLKLATRFKRYPNDHYSTDDKNTLVNGCRELVDFCETNSVDRVPFI